MVAMPTAATSNGLDCRPGKPSAAQTADPELPQPASIPRPAEGASLQDPRRLLGQASRGSWAAAGPSGAWLVVSVPGLFACRAHLPKPCRPSGFSGGFMCGGLEAGRARPGCQLLGSSRGRSVACGWSSSSVTLCITSVSPCPPREGRWSDCVRANPLKSPFNLLSAKDPLSTRPHLDRTQPVNSHLTEPLLTR